MTDAAPIIVLVAILVVLWLFWIHIPASMARNRGRSALGWVLLAWVLSGQGENPVFRITKKYVPLNR